jgi:hypothetical protein
VHLILGCRSHERCVSRVRMFKKFSIVIQLHLYRIMTLFGTVVTSLFNVYALPAVSL